MITLQPIRFQEPNALYTYYILRSLLKGIFFSDNTVSYLIKKTFIIHSNILENMKKINTNMHMKKYMSSYRLKGYPDKIPPNKSLWMPLSANLLKLESSILTRANRKKNGPFPVNDLQIVNWTLFLDEPKQRSYRKTKLIFFFWIFFLEHISKNFQFFFFQIYMKDRQSA